MPIGFKYTYDQFVRICYKSGRSLTFKQIEHFYLKTDRWYSLRDARLIADNHRCRMCNAPATCVHHRVYPDVLGTESIDDLTSLCHQCHANFHCPPSLELVKSQIDTRAKETNKGVICPVCDRYLQQYKRTIYDSMAKAMLWTYRFFEENDVEWVHFQSRAPKNLCKGGDYAKLKFWGLVEPKPKSTDKKTNSSGYWKITPKGKQFCLKQITVQKVAVVFKDKLQKFSGKQISITDALNDKFDYERMLNLMSDTGED